MSALTPHLFLFFSFKGNTLYDEDTFEAGFLKTILNIDVPLKTQIGARCSPISVLAIGKGASWYVHKL
jgi:hypothetical protein